MDNDVISEMNSEIGIGAALDVDDDQEAEFLQEEHERDAEADEK